MATQSFNPQTNLLSKGPVELSTGRTVFHNKTPTGEMHAYIADGSAMTEEEWQEFAVLTRSIPRARGLPHCQQHS